jgi:SAM-dependent methyltransferase
MNRIRRWVISAGVLGLALGLNDALAKGPGKKPSEPTQAAAERMIGAAQGSLAPVYAPLAQEIVERLDLRGVEGVGIDLGSGPGTLILKLCRHTRLHWVNADINPHFFPYFMREADEAGLSGRVSAVRADACRLPFRRNLAAVVVSRGSFHFWPDLKKGLAEVRRVLKPGGVAYIGRGFPERLPPGTAKEVRGNQGGGPKYDVDETEQKLRRIVEELKIEDYRIHRPRPEKPEGVNYGLWLEFHKPKQ